MKVNGGNLVRQNFARIAPIILLIALAEPAVSPAQSDTQQPPKDQGQAQQGQQGQGQAAPESTAPAPRDQTSKDAVPRPGARQLLPPVKSEDIVFTPRDQQLIRQWFLMNGTDVTLGLAKLDGGLPPAVEQQLKRNSIVPFELRKQINVFPPNLARQMSSIPKEYFRGTLGIYALILDRNFKIMDLMRFR